MTLKDIHNQIQTQDKSKITEHKIYIYAYFVKEQPQVDLYSVSELDLKMISDCYVRGRERIF